MNRNSSYHYENYHTHHHEVPLDQHISNMKPLHQEVAYKESYDVPISKEEAHHIRSLSKRSKSQRNVGYETYNYGDNFEQDDRHFQGKFYQPLDHLSRSQHIETHNKIMAPKRHDNHAYTDINYNRGYEQNFRQSSPYQAENYRYTSFPQK